MTTVDEKPAQRSAYVAKLPTELYLETTNRCNLACTTCPQYFGMPEESGDLTLHQVQLIVDQLPDLRRVVLHGIGEPLLNKSLVQIIELLKRRGAHVLFNTNGLLLRGRLVEPLIGSGLDELRVSVDSAEPETYAAIRGVDGLDRIFENLKTFETTKRRLGATTPVVSLWITGMKTNVQELPKLVRRAADMGIGEVYLQRLVFSGRGHAVEDEALFHRSTDQERSAVAEAERLAKELGVRLKGSGEVNEVSVFMSDDEPDVPYQHCRRPWSLMYITANGNALPCCIAPFTTAPYEEITLGNVFDETLEEIWNGPRYQDWRKRMLGDRPPLACARLRLELESLTGDQSRLVLASFLSLLCLAGGSFAYFADLSLARHHAFQSNAYDLGFFDQIIWNTSRGHLFETSFVFYNFLGQHFDPILLFFAGVYRLGGNVETLLVLQSAFAALAAVPLFFAASRLTRSSAVGLACGAAFLLSPQLHEALRAGFHPELGIFFFVFLAAYFLAGSKPRAAMLAVLPLLLFKEDQALIVLAFAVLLAWRGHRREGVYLGAIAVAWIVAVVFVIMPHIRGGPSDLTERYGYLYDGAGLLSFVPDVVQRGFDHMRHFTLPTTLDILTSTGWLALLSPIALLTALPVLFLNGLAAHQQQAELSLHYSVPFLAMVWLATLLGFERLSRIRWRQPYLMTAGAALLLVSALLSARSESRWWPPVQSEALSPAHAAALNDAIALIPPDASVDAQTTILPHLSERRNVFEFPGWGGSQYVIVDSGLPITDQVRDAGYADKLAELPSDGYEKIFDREGVQVWRLKT